MSKRGKRKAFGVSKKAACDLHRCLKKKTNKEKISSGSASKVRSPHAIKTIVART